MRVCELIEQDGRPNWCARHLCYHDGEDTYLALAPTIEGAAFRYGLDRARTAKKVLLRNHQSPGDALVITAALEAMQRYYPFQHLFKLDTPYPAIFEYNHHGAGF